MMQIPSPIQKTLVKAGCLGAAVLAFGTIWGIASHDRVILLLSAAVAVLGGGKMLSIYRAAASKHYEVLEGTVLDDRQVPLRNRHVILIEDVNQNAHKLVLAGKATLKPGIVCRLYISGGEVQETLGALPDSLQPARSLLGYEVLS